MMVFGTLGAAEAQRVYIERAHQARSRMVLKAAGLAFAGLGRITAQVTVGVLRLGRSLIERAMNAHRRRVALFALEALDDRILSDIGLSRGSLPFATGQASTGIAKVETRRSHGTADAVLDYRRIAAGLARAEQQRAA
jgi:uncharacterized protein YjiS (DUF1127 family)